MYKFFVKENQIKDNEITILGSDVNHIKNVLRISVGEKICICNSDTAISYISQVKGYINNAVVCEILETKLDTTETKTYIHIFQGLPKADKLELIIEKCTEIGVKEITPVVMNRTIVKLEEKDKIKKIERWNKIAEVASKQSKRDSILKVNNIISFKEVFEIAKKYDILLIAYEEEENNTLKQVLKEIKREDDNFKIAVLIGPEGGIAEEEIELARNYTNTKIVTLGKRILRTETASLVISSNILYELEDK